MSMAPDHDRFGDFWLVRTSDYDLWSRLRELLKIQGLDPNRTVVVDLLQEGPDHEDGQVVSDDGRVYKFTLFYDQAAEHGARGAYLRGWTDNSDSRGAPNHWILEQQTP